MSQQINLFNPIFLQQKKYFSLVTMLQALGCIVVGAALIYGYARHQVRQLELQSAETAARYADAQGKLAKYASEYSPQQASQMLEQELKEAEARLAAEQALVNRLKSGALGNTTGYSEYLRAFAREVVPGLWLTGFTIAGDAKVTLKGGVLQPGLLPEYLRRLKREQVMQGKTFAALEMQQPKAEEGSPAARRYVEFTLESREPGEGEKR